MSVSGSAAADNPRDRAPASKFRLHVGAVALREYHARILEFWADKEVPLYLDTSALTWLIRVGSSARSELLQWFRRDEMADRAFVPIWAAHELHGVLRSKGPLNDANGELRRHSQGLQGMLTDLAFQASAERCGGVDIVEFVQEVVGDIKDLDEKLTIMTKGEDWYRVAEREVVDFVNERVIAGDIFALIDEVLPPAERRLSVRLPPGYLDADKADNRAGDVIFWREILRHAKGHGAKRLIVLTNDNKGDWTFAPSRVADYSGNEKGDDPLKGVQARLTHPMLVHEARWAELDDVLVLNPMLLSVALDRLDKSSVKALVAAAHPPRLKPAAEAGIDWRNMEPPVSNRQARRARAAASTTETVPVEPFEELLEALRERAPADGTNAEVVARLDGNATERLEAFEALTRPDGLKGSGLAQVASLGRALYGAAAGDDRLARLIKQVVGDLAASSPLPANALLLGMCADVYFDEELRPRQAPRGGPHDALFSLAADPIFAQASAAVSALLDRNAMRLLARPSATSTTVALTFSTRRTFNQSTKLLEQVRADDTELLCEVEPESRDALVAVLGRSDGTVADLTGVIARRMTVPAAWLVPDIAGDTHLRWPATLGVRVLRPSGGGVIDPSDSDGT